MPLPPGTPLFRRMVVRSLPESCLHLFTFFIIKPVNKQKKPGGKQRYQNYGGGMHDLRY